jgi:oxygen-dependent protoporphyrinogen oxidase
MPQYLVGHLKRVEELQGLLARCSGLYLAGSAYRGVGIPDCVRDGTETGGRVIEDLFRP